MEKSKERRVKAWSMRKILLSQGETDNKPYAENKT